MRLPKFRLPDKVFNAASLAIIGAAIVLVIAGVGYYVQQEKQRKAIEEQTSATNALILEVKALSEENRELNKQNRDFAYCNAVLFAKYTRDKEPIVIEDLEKCIFTSFPQDEDESDFTLFFEPQRTQSSNTVQPSTGNPQTPRNPNGSPITPNNPNNPEGPQKPSNELLTIEDLLEINTPCADLLGLIKTC